MAGCVVCGKESPAYRCPLCLERYCSVSCNKAHKLACSVSETPKSSAVENSPRPDLQTPEHIYDKIAKAPEVTNLLRSTALQKHLQLVASILRSPEVSGEQTQEGRRAVALKKLRRLRKGGSEENEAVEEFACLSCRLLENSGIRD